MGFDLTELEQSERLAPYVTVEHRGEWCQVLMSRDLKPTRAMASPMARPHQ
jgi:hypothetical protein